MLDKNNIFHDLIVEVKTLTASHNPIPLFDDLNKGKRGNGRKEAENIKIMTRKQGEIE